MVALLCNRTFRIISPIGDRTSKGLENLSGCSPPVLPYHPLYSKANAHSALPWPIWSLGAGINGARAWIAGLIPSLLHGSSFSEDVTPRPSETRDMFRSSFHFGTNTFCPLVTCFCGYITKVGSHPVRFGRCDTSRCWTLLGGPFPSFGCSADRIIL